MQQQQNEEGDDEAALVDAFFLPGGILDPEIEQESDAIAPAPPVPFTIAPVMPISYDNPWSLSLESLPTESQRKDAVQRIEQPSLDIIPDWLGGAGLNPLAKPHEPAAIRSPQRRAVDLVAGERMSNGEDQQIALSSPPGFQSYRPPIPLPSTTENSEPEGLKFIGTSEGFKVGSTAIRPNDLPCQQLPDSDIGTITQCDVRKSPSAVRTNGDGNMDSWIPTSEVLTDSSPEWKKNGLLDSQSDHRGFENRDKTPILTSLHSGDVYISEKQREDTPSNNGAGIENVEIEETSSSTNSTERDATLECTLDEEARGQEKSLVNDGVCVLEEISVVNDRNEAKSGSSKENTPVSHSLAAGTEKVNAEARRDKRQSRRRVRTPDERTEMKTSSELPPMVPSMEVPLFTWATLVSDKFIEVSRWAGEVYEACIPIFRQLFMSMGFTVAVVAQWAVVALLGMGSILRYATRQAAQRDETLYCYGVFFLAPTLCNFVMSNFNLPHFTPHTMSSLLLIYLCRGLNKSSSPGRRKIRTASTGIAVEAICRDLVWYARLAIPCAVLIEGFGNQNIGIMMLDCSTRLVMAYLLALVRECLVFSPLAWFGWAAQVLAVALPLSGGVESGLVLTLGLASIRLTTTVHADMPKLA